MSAVNQNIILLISITDRKLPSALEEGDELHAGRRLLVYETAQDPGRVVSDRVTEDRLDSEEEMGEDRWRGQVERESADTFQFRLLLSLLILII